MRTKQIRFQNAIDEPLLIQSGKDFFEHCKGKRRSDYFANTNPIVLELACGRGEYTVGLSQVYPDKNFIGVDVKGERMMLGIKSYKSQVLSAKGDELGDNLQLTTQHLTLPNIAFLRTIIHHLDSFFAPGEVDEIWIVHPDPRPKGHDERRRLTSPRFLRMYADILKPGGLLRLKTDDDGLFEYSIEKIGRIEKIGGIEGEKKMFHLMNQTTDLHHSPLLADHHGIITHYEREALDAGKTIKYAVWQKAKRSEVPKTFGIAESNRK